VNTKSTTVHITCTVCQLTTWWQDMSLLMFLCLCWQNVLAAADLMWWGMFQIQFQPLYMRQHRYILQWYRGGWCLDQILQCGVEGSSSPNYNTVILSLKNLPVIFLDDYGISCVSCSSYSPHCEGAPKQQVYPVQWTSYMASATQLMVFSQEYNVLESDRIVTHLEQARLFQRGSLWPWQQSLWTH